MIREWQWSKWLCYAIAWRSLDTWAPEMLVYRVMGSDWYRTEGRRIRAAGFGRDVDSH